MNPQLHWKLFALFVSLLLLFVLIQWLLVFLFAKPLLLAAFLSFICVSAIAYHLLLKFFTRPIQDRFLKTIHEMNLKLKDTINEISRKKDYLQAVLKGMAEGVLVVDAKGRIQMVNEALRKLFSLPQDVLDRTLLEVIRHTELKEATQQAIRDGKSAAFELTLPYLPRKNYEVSVVPISSSPGIEQEEREIEGAIAVFHDISRLKELERVRRDFVANVSHELRTPLTTIKGYAETLLEGAMKEEVAVQFVQAIQRQTDRLVKIVEDLLMLSKIESSEFRLKLEVISLSEFIADAIDLIKEAAEKKKISILKNDIPPFLSVQADRDFLEQALLNLLDNAVKYGRENGEITISAMQKGQKEILFAVRDNGVGIPKEDLSRIFERFYRVEKGRSRESGGTGLGLSIVKHIVQAHSGRIWAESRLEEGSTFYFILPTTTHPSLFAGEEWG